MNANEPEGIEDLIVPDELASLKARADLMHLKYHPTISLDKLREKVSAAVADAPKLSASEAMAQARVTGIAVAEETEAAIRFRKRKEANELVRIRVACMNPAKKDWVGEVFTVGNSLVGSFTKYIPFDVEEGWHVPRIIYNQLVERKCQIFNTVRDARGNSKREGKLIREFAIEVLPALTVAELADLAQRQAMAKSID